MMSVVVDVSAYDWEGDAPLQRPWEPLEFELSPIAGGGRLPWRRWIDTFLDSPHDIVDWERAPSVGGRTYSTVPRSVVVLFARLDPE